MPPTAAPLVSVIIPCYRQGRFLRMAVDSALAQTYPHVEILVINDGSDDDTDEVARGYGDRIRYFSRTNAGLCASRNLGMAEARGAYFKFLDADDHLHPDQLAWQVEALAGRTDALALTAVRLYRDDHPEEYQDHAPQPRALLPFLLEDDEDWLPPISYLVPAGLARAAGFNESLRFLEDWDFFSRIGLSDPPLVSDRRVGANYRLRPGSMSANRQQMARTRARLLIDLHDVLRERGRPDWFGLGLLKAEQSSYHQLGMVGADDPELLGQLLPRIKELQGRVGFGQFGWRFRLLTLCVGYARAERIRTRLVKWLGKRPPETLDTGTWREIGG
jgi:glycosyltransferase involved in cell wall biosynthesis